MEEKEHLNKILKENQDIEKTGKKRIFFDNEECNLLEKTAKFETQNNKFLVNEILLSKETKNTNEATLSFPQKDADVLNASESSNSEKKIPIRKFKAPSIVKEQSETERRSERKRIRYNEMNQNYETYVSSQNVTDLVRQYYNEKPEVGRKRRESSPIIGLRNFNNWIKSALIRKFSKMFPRDIAILVLDIGCGKGGDLLKWVKAGIAGYIGIDSAEVSIMQARERYRRLKFFNFVAKFYVLDCYTNPLESILPPDERKFDIVSMQFSMHYAFETEAKCHQMLSNVSKSLTRGGKFIGTIPSSDFIIEKIKKLKDGEKEWGNSIYKIQFANRPLSEFRPPFGHCYNFYLEDAITDVPEYVVPFEAFRALAQDYNLEMLYCRRFHDIFFEEQKDHDIKMLLERMKLVDMQGKRIISDDEWDVAGFYLAFAFEKRGI
ncbi:mRNA (guanine-N7)-methyltransferase [Pneumocystis jirovecii RU7]|uniref:mRNA cap guanine-N(7) methyltransferase n=1 Tax=Pneumocystis jirovecii (strain RU7) TaxID=1408657 RepID=A0A0W4ZU67_PNEJ7|nr:mRNA (guanine-N7)-methyltransferase [Pneumocystis jirovecii RU7]KTW31913.1 hypothetical protein T551_01174 [Pneumocystis jirovecii RU7]